VYADSVTVLTDDNFYSIVDGSKPAFIEFYAPWCGHCKNLAPQYDIVGDIFKPLASSVVVAKVDCDAHKDLCQKHGVSGYPTLKWFPQGRPEEPEPYSGGRTTEDIVAFINGKTGLKARIKKAPSQVVELTDANFDAVVLDPKKNVFVEFFAPWCGHCKKLAPEWEKLGQVFGSEEEVVIAKYDADANKGNGEKYGVTGFPTLIWFPKDNKKGENYEGEREVAGLVEFVNDKAGTRRLANGLLDETSGRVATLDVLAQKFLSSSSKAEVLKEAQAASTSLSGADAVSAKFYTHVMQKAIDNGDSFLTTEGARLHRIITSGSVAGSKIDEFTKRLNIIKAFEKNE
jgi:protein disulfide-isomerase-like protein